MKALTAFASTIAVAMLAACGSAPVVRPGPGPVPTASLEQADQRLEAVGRERAAIEARFAERQRVCYEKFFVNHCLDEAKERRRAALQAQRDIEIEAERFKRLAKVEERDRAMAEAEAQYKAEETRMAAEPPPAPRAAAEDAPPPRPAPVADRMAKHNQKLKEAAAREQAEAGKRAENVRRYEQRKKEAEERQRRVAERRAEKAAKEAKEQGKDVPVQQQKQQ